MERSLLSFFRFTAKRFSLNVVSFWCEALNGSQVLTSFKNSANFHVQDETSHVATQTATCTKRAHGFNTHLKGGRNLEPREAKSAGKRSHYWF